MRAEKVGALPKRLAGFGDQMRGELPGMRNNRPNFQFDGNACGAGALGEARGIIAQDFVRADVNQKRRKSGKIGIQGRREGIARIGIAKIVARRSREIRSKRRRCRARP